MSEPPHPMSAVNKRNWAKIATWVLAVRSRKPEQVKAIFFCALVPGQNLHPGVKCKNHSVLSDSDRTELRLYILFWAVTGPPPGCPDRYEMWFHLAYLAASTGTGECVERHD